MPHHPGVCRTCGSSDTVHLGELPDVADFAGTRLDTALEGGHLLRCRSCSFLFRTPILGDDEYLSLYARGSPEIWEPGDDREDFRLVRSRVGDAPLDVLDVGCYTGHLLASLPATCRLHGVEPNAAAAAIAESRGVRVLAGNWAQSESVAQAFDLIIACDVIEHVGDPLAFMTLLACRLRVGGRLIITTGNADAWMWRLLRSRFWYCRYPEHISFIGTRWLARMAGRASLKVSDLQFFSHRRLPAPVRRFKALVRTGLEWSSPRSLAWQHRSAAGAAGLEAGPLGAGLTKDHLLCVLERQ
jgi:SAM-dependent methyltransferase